MSGQMGVTHRYHIGESLIPSVRHYLRFVCAEENVEGYGFMHEVRPRASVCVVRLVCGVRKPGAALKSDQFKREGCM